MPDATSLHHCLKNKQLKLNAFSGKRIQQNEYDLPYSQKCLRTKELCAIFLFLFCSFELHIHLLFINGFFCVIKVCDSQILQNLTFLAPWCISSASSIVPSIKLLQCRKPACRNFCLLV